MIEVKLYPSVAGHPPRVRMIRGVRAPGYGDDTTFTGAVTNRPGGETNGVKPADGEPAVPRGQGPALSPSSEHCLVFHAESAESAENYSCRLFSALSALSA